MLPLLLAAVTALDVVPYFAVPVVIPAAVTSIGEKAFGGCDSLTSVTVYIKNPLAIPESPSDMTDVSELYSDGFDVQQPNPNSVGDNNG